MRKCACTSAKIRVDYFKIKVWIFKNVLVAPQLSILNIYIIIEILFLDCLFIFYYIFNICKNNNIDL